MKFLPILASSLLVLSLAAMWWWWEGEPLVRTETLLGVNEHTRAAIPSLQLLKSTDNRSTQSKLQVPAYELSAVVAQGATAEPDTAVSQKDLQMVSNGDELPGKVTKAPKPAQLISLADGFQMFEVLEFDTSVDTFP